MNLNLAAALPARLPRAIEWAQAQSEDALRNGTPLTRTESDFARQVGVQHPERVRLNVVEALPAPDDPELQQAAIQAGLLGPGMVGLTLGYAVFVCTGHVARIAVLCYVRARTRVRSKELGDPDGLTLHG